MSGLNLEPNPLVMACQAVLVTSCAYVVKKLILEPYQSIKLKQKSETDDVVQSASDLKLTNDEIKRLIEEKTANVYKESYERARIIKKEAESSKNDIVSQATKSAKELVKKTESDLKSHLDANMLTVNQYVSSLSNKAIEKLFLGKQ